MSDFKVSVESKTIEIDNKKYHFYRVYSPPKEAGIYIVYGFDEHNNSDRIRYVGQDENIKNSINGHEKEKCWKEYENNPDDTKIYVHLGLDEEKRADIKEKIIDKFNPPCNKE